MNYDGFSKIVQASKNCERLIFRGLKFIKAGKIDFGRDLDYKISYLSLCWAGKQKRCNWGIDRAEFLNILKEIRESKMEKQLQTIDIHQCNLTVAEVALSGVDVVFEGPKPLEV